MIHIDKLTYYREKHLNVDFSNFNGTLILSQFYSTVRYLLYCFYKQAVRFPKHVKKMSKSSINTKFVDASLEIIKFKLQTNEICDKLYVVLIGNNLILYA